MLEGFISAVRTLSVLPMPGREADRMTASLPWFPVVGALLGAILYGLWWLIHLAGLGGWSAGMALVLVSAAAVLTRGLHLDGLADAADGLFSMTGKTRTLEIMKDSRIGTFGVLALLMTIGLKWVALERLLVLEGVIWMLPAFVVSRAAMVELSASLPYAREAAGTGAPFVNGAGARHKLGGWLIAAILVAPVGPLALLAPVIGYITVKVLGRVCLKRLGGVTGDLLGAACEITETLLLLIGASAAAKLRDAVSWEQLLR
jgi:adenosylcobinamide-GDP ribazoletransferase